MSKECWKPGNMLYPLPAVMVSCSEPGKPDNIITVAWTGTVCTNPPMVYISVRPERHSYDMIKNSGEFVINLTTQSLVKATDYCGVRSGREVDKFAEMHLTKEMATHVNVPLIKESPVNIECKVREVKELGSHHMFLADVVGVNIDPKYLDEKGKFCLNDAGLIMYSHGEYYEMGELLGSFGYAVRKNKKGKGKEKRKA
ncbi:MAG: flavin reductase family protein [Lachnospiraceae bacterium]|nr:flavin reductase family protein [Lachnospiraceae bacterium]